MKIVITDAGSRKSFDVINIFKQKYKLETILFSSSEDRILLPIIYRQKVHRLRYDTYTEFKADFMSGLDAYKNEELYYLPLSEEPTLHFYDFLEEEIPFKIRSLLPEKKVFELTRNKKEFQKFCEAHKLPIPRSYNEQTIENLIDSFHPVVAKKTIGAGSVGMKYVNSTDQLQLLDDINYNEYLIQEKIESNRTIHGGFFLCQDGEVLVYHGHVRIRTFPEKGGVTVFSKADFDMELKRLGQKLLEKLNWSGFAMIEFMYDNKHQEWRIIELNPRLWGSVMLSEFCNSGLLINYIRICQGKSVQDGNLKTNRYIRWLFPFELISFLKGKLNVSDFLNFKGYPTCYINFSYSRWYAAILYLFYFTFNKKSIARFFKKIFS